MSDNNFVIGNFTLLIGKMFDGKSEELINHAKRLEENTHIKVLFFVSRKDDRDDDNFIVSHDGTKREVIKIDSPFEIFDYLDTNKKQEIIIDEIQFFNFDDIYYTIITLKRLGYIITAAGLALDYQGKPFGGTLNLIAFADKTIFLEKARCTHISASGKICGKIAKYSQRVDKKGLPISDNGKIIKTGRGKNKKGHTAYAPRCEEHFKWPRKAEKHLAIAKGNILCNKIKISTN